MKLRTCLMVFFIPITMALSGQEIPKCNETILVVTMNNMGQLTEKHVTTFWLNMGKECKDKGGFTEWNRDVMYSMLDKHPELVLKTLEKLQKKVEMDEVYDAFSTPMNEMVDMKYFITKVSSVKFGRRLKQQLIEKLKIADNKMTKGESK